MNDIGNAAILSPCGTYRFRLDRHVGAGDTVAAVIGVNPSTADAVRNDHTVSKWRGFGMRSGWRRFIVGNVFAYRAADVRALKQVSDPFGPDYHKVMDEIVAEADVLIPCWGDRKKLPTVLRPHLDTMLARLRATGKPVMCWGVTAGGDPLHPLTLAYATPLVAMPEKWPRKEEA